MRKRFSNRALLIGGGALLLLLVVTGRLNPLFAVFGALIPIAHRAMGLFQLFNRAQGFHSNFKAGQGPSPGQSSTVETAILRMSLDHDSGDMDGEILSGPFTGKRLVSLSKVEQLELYRFCLSSDPSSASLLAAFLDRTYPSGWREEGFQTDSSHDLSGGSTAMSRKEAMEVLGVGPKASKQDIIDSHRRLMQRMHPDRGGSNYLAIKINQAKERLLSD